MIENVFKRLRVVADTIQRLREDDLVEVLWLDACITRDVSKLTNRAFATYKRTIGYYWKVENDQRYKMPHLILKQEITDGDTTDITSIPLGWIVKVEKLGAKQVLSTYKERVLIKVPIRIVKLKRAEYIEKLEGGSTKIVGCMSNIIWGKK